MDYKFIYQLLERYNEGQTSLSEERLLCDFFEGDDIPADLEMYRQWFALCRESRAVKLEGKAEEQLLARYGCSPKRRVSAATVLRYCYHVAACAAILFCVATGAQRLFRQEPKVEEVTFNYSSFQDATADPQVAYEQVYGSLRKLSDGLQSAGLYIDSVRIVKQ